MKSNPSWQNAPSRVFNYLNASGAPERSPLLWNNGAVTNVTYEQIQDFARKLTAMDPEYEYRLPTEVEWRWAARHFDVEQADQVAKGLKKNSSDPFTPLSSLADRPPNTYPFPRSGCCEKLVQLE